MRSLSDFLDCSLRKQKSGPREYWIVELSAPRKLKGLIDYCSAFPLFTSKYNDFIDEIIDVVDRLAHGLLFSM